MAGPSAQQDGDNSDLEVVDVISAKPTRKAKDPEVVELSDSDSESEAEEERAGSSSSQNQPSTAPQGTQSKVYLGVESNCHGDLQCNAGFAGRRRNLHHLQ